MHKKKELEAYRTLLRKEATRAERLLWHFLRNKRLAGRKFKRQHSIHNFIVDFYCPSAKLIIELDGPYHRHPDRIQSDKKKPSFWKDWDLK